MAALIKQTEPVADRVAAEMERAIPAVQEILLALIRHREITGGQLQVLLRTTAVAVVVALLLLGQMELDLLAVMVVRALFLLFLT
jgi:hypothetical protein